MQKNKTTAIVLIFCMLTATPQLTMSLAYSQTRKQTPPSLLSAKTRSSTMTSEALGETLRIEESILLEEWTNGTKITISERVGEQVPTPTTDYEQLRGKCVNVCVNFTFWNSSETLQKRTIEKSFNERSYTLRATDYPEYPYENWTDDLLFVLPGNDGFRLVTYHHDYNYDTYYPEQWYKQYNLTGDSMYHVHLTKDHMENWLNGIEDRSTIIAIALGGIGGGLSVIGGVATFLHCPYAAVPAIIGGISAIIAAFLALFGYTDASWLQDHVIERYAGDAWTWISKAVRMDTTDAVFLQRITPEIENGGDCERVHRYILSYVATGTRYWTQSWGDEGVFGGGQYSTQYDYGGYMKYFS